MKTPLSYLYYTLTTTQRKFFQLFPFLSYRPKAKVISIGNMTTGGTGKTPVLFELIKEFSDKTTCVLTRGYRSKYENNFYVLKGENPETALITDESVLLNKKFPHIPILIGKNRNHSAKMADKIIKPDILFLDDGFQYRRLKKDFNILLWDAMSEKDEARLIPLGTMREPAELIKNADAIILTRCETASEQKQQHWLNYLKHQAPNVQIIKAASFCDGVFDSKEEKVQLSECISFCAIGRPNSFYAQLKSIGASAKHKFEFRDHHIFSNDELNKITALAKTTKLPVVCTEKDYVKLDKTFIAKHNILKLRIRVRPLSRESFRSALRL